MKVVHGEDWVFLGIALEKWKCWRGQVFGNCLADGWREKGTPGVTNRQTFTDAIRLWMIDRLFLGSQWSIILGYRRLSVKSLTVGNKNQGFYRRLPRSEFLFVHFLEAHSRLQSSLVTAWRLRTHIDGYTSSSKFSGSCVLTLQTLPLVFIGVC